jgi:hypothetical protein
VDKESPNFIQLSEQEIKASEACRDFNRFLETHKSVAVGKSAMIRKKEELRAAKYGVPGPDTVRGFEIIRDRVYPAVAHAVRQLNRQGIITRQQLAEADLHYLRAKKGFGPGTMYVSVLLQNICRAEKDENIPGSDI